MDRLFEEMKKVELFKKYDKIRIYLNKSCLDYTLRCVSFLC